MKQSFTKLKTNKKKRGSSDIINIGTSLLSAYFLNILRLADSEIHGGSRFVRTGKLR